MAYLLVLCDELEYLLTRHLRLFLNGRLGLAEFHCASRSRVIRRSFRVMLEYGRRTCKQPFAFFTPVFLELKQMSDFAKEVRQLT